MYHNVQGLFEIHISVNPNQQWEHRLFCMKHKIKPIFTCEKYGDNRNQLMISKWTSGDGAKAIGKAFAIADLMKSSGLEVQRIKVEAMAGNSGVPLEENDDHEKGHYFEFHIKIPVMGDVDLMRKICELSETLGYAVSFSAFKEHIAALITMRIAAHLGYKNAEMLKDRFMDYLKLNGIDTNEQIQKEFSIYDDNVDYDRGWISSVENI